MKLDKEISKKQLILGGIILFVVIAMFNTEDPSTAIIIDNTAVESQDELGGVKNGAPIPSDVVVGGSDAQKEAIDQENQPDTQEYLVIKVVDGDTIKVSFNGETKSVRLIGIDTPETVHPSKPVQCFGIEASNKAKELLSNNKVLLEFDPTQGEQDKYGRILAYVFLQDGTNFNDYMIRNGYAYEYTYSSAYKYQSLFKSSQKEAESNQRGLWASGVCEEEVESIPIPIIPTQTQQSSEYTCSSNVYNCGDFSTHAEAQNVYETCGGVNNDIHKLDRDLDGEACETLP